MQGVWDWLEEVEQLTGGKDIGVIISIGKNKKLHEYLNELRDINGSYIRMACHQNGVIAVPTDRRWEDEVESDEKIVNEVPWSVGNTPAHHMWHEYGHFLCIGGMHRDTLSRNERGCVKINNLIEDEDYRIESGLIDEDDMNLWKYSLSKCILDEKTGEPILEELYAETACAMMTGDRIEYITEYVMYIILKDIDAHTSIEFPEGHHLKEKKDHLYSIYDNEYALY